MDYSYGFGVPASIDARLKAEEVEKLVKVAKEIDITITKDDYLFLCNLVFGKISDSFIEALAKIAFSHIGGEQDSTEKQPEDNLLKSEDDDAQKANP